MSIKHAMLGLLVSGPQHGYELKSAYEAELSPSAQLNFGQVYTTLDRLAETGLVSSQVVVQEGRPDKTVYALTDKGKQELLEWLHTPSKHELDLRNETFLKLLLARRLPEGKPLEVLARERRACFERLRELTDARAEAETRKAGLPARLILDLGILRLEAFIKWLDRCEEAFTRQDSTASERGKR